MAENAVSQDSEDTESYNTGDAAADDDDDDDSKYAHIYEMRVQDKVRLEFALCPKTRYLLQLFDGRAMLAKRVDATVTSPASWLALNTLKCAKRHLVYSLCRDVVVSSKTPAVRGSRGPTIVLGLLDLLFDSLFMERGVWYPASGDFPDVLRVVGTHSFNTFALHNFDAACTIGRKGNYRLAVSFDLWVDQNALGEYHCHMRGGMRSRVPLPDILAAVFPDSAPVLRLARPRAASVAAAHDILDFLRARALAHTATSTSPLADDVSLALGPTASGPRKRRATTLSASASTSASASGSVHALKRRKRSKSGGECEAVRKWERCVLTQDRRRSATDVPLYAAIARVKEPSRHMDDDDDDDEDLPKETWQLGYCPLNGHVVLEDMPSFERLRHFHLGGLLWDVPADAKMRLVGLLSTAPPGATVSCAEQETQSQTCTSLAQIPSQVHANNSTAAVTSPAPEHVDREDAPHGTVPAVAAAVHACVRAETQAAVQAVVHAVAQGVEREVARTVVPAAMHRVVQEVVQEVAQAQVPESEAQVDAATAMQNEARRLLQEIWEASALHRHSLLPIRHAVVPRQSQATLLLCHPGTKGAWTSSLSQVPGLDVVALKKGAGPTDEQLLSRRTVLVATYTYFAECAASRDAPGPHFSPYECTYYRAVFDDAHLLNADTEKGSVPFKVRATVRWSFGATHAMDPAAALSAAFNAYAAAVLLTRQSLRMYWTQIQPALMATALVFPAALVFPTALASPTALVFPPTALAVPPKVPSAVLHQSIEGVRAQLTAAGRAQYRAAHAAADMCIAKTGEKHLVAATPAEYNALCARAAQTAALRMAKKRRLLSETKHPLRGLRCTFVPPAEFADRECSICFEPVRNNRAVRLTQCDHYLCTDCQAECAERRLAACPMCRKPNPTSTRRLLVDADFDPSDLWVHHTTKADVLAAMHAGADKPLVVVCRSAVTALFLRKTMRLRKIPVLDYSRVRTPAHFARVRAMDRGLLLISARLARHSLQLCTSVAAVVFFEPCMTPPTGTITCEPYATAWSCEALAAKKVLYTAGTLEETALKRGRDAARAQQTPRVTLALPATPQPLKLG
jgi:hypothetical protein